LPIFPFLPDSVLAESAPPPFVFAAAAAIAQTDNKANFLSHSNSFRKRRKRVGLSAAIGIERPINRVHY
jgi:hypothetical protein